MGIFDIIKNEDREEPFIDSGICIDCEWDGLLKDADIEYDWDDFRREDIPYPICPKCGGGLDDFYPSELFSD